MSEQQHPRIPSPAHSSAQPGMQQKSDVIMGGVDLPKFSSEMQAEISPEAAPLWNFVSNHAPKIAAGVVGIVVVILAVAAWQWHAEKQLAEARGQMGKILSIQDPARRTSELEKFIAEAPSALKLAGQLELAGAAAVSGDWKKAAGAYASVAEQEGKTPLGFTARLNHAQIIMRTGDFAAAEKELKALAAEAPKENAAILHQQAAEAAEAAGDKASAISSYEAAVAALPPTDAQSLDYFRARIAALKK